MPTDLIEQLVGRSRPNDITGFLRDVARSFQVPIISRAAVLEVLFDPVSLTEERIREIRKKYNEDLPLLDTAPRHAIIARSLRRLGEVVSKPTVFYPFFGPHHLTPVKPGEHVWVFYESADGVRDLGFWMSRVQENRFVDDANYTHADRKWFALSKQPKSGEDPLADGDPVHGFPNGMDAAETFSLSQSTGKNAYDDIVEFADASDAHAIEPVPRFTARPGDHVIQGSNNTLIVLGEDRTSVAVSRGADGSIVGRGDGDQLPPGVGAVDVVVGRGQVAPTAPMVVKNARGAEETEKNPQAKGDQELITEGDADFESDLSRIYVAMKTDADVAFGISPTPGAKDDPGQKDPAPAVVIKTDQARIIARQNIKFIVAPPGADPVVDGGKFASFVIQTDGNIVLVPGIDGVVKIGGEDADRALLCTDAPAQVVGGRVVAAPILTTMGGQVGVGASGLGTFAAKVLVSVG